MPRHTERSLYRRLARASGETIRTLQNRGFQLVDDVESRAVFHDEETVFDRAPLFIDWDELDGRFGVGVQPLARAS
ncbi:MAG TPA: hypothetical protein VGE52_06795 [Pirellulales bacterium]